MKSLTTIIFLLIISLSAIGQSTYKALKKEGYHQISTQKFEEIESAVHEQDDWDPILLEGFSKSELVAFYTQKYSDSSIEEWIDWAYEKMQKYAKPTHEQDVEFKKILELPRNRENMYYFMMIMTKDQISHVGY